MTQSGNNVSRRGLIKGAASLGWIGAGIALSATEARAQKMAPKAAEYQTTPKNGQQCSGCALFEPPSACKIVEGAISPNGWCKFFVKKT